MVKCKIVLKTIRIYDDGEWLNKKVKLSALQPIDEKSKQAIIKKQG